MTTTLLKARKMTKRFGGLTAVEAADLDCYEGEVTGLIGPNGAGKTTLVNLLCGELVATSGQVEFLGTDITALPPHLRARLGMVRTFQQVRLFPQQTVRMNVEVGAYQQCKSGMIGAMARTRRVLSDEKVMREAAERALEITGLGHRADALAGELSTGEQRLVGVARALAAGPRLLIVDEPAAGLNDSETAQLRDTIEALRNQGISLLVVEHNMRLIMSTCDRITVLAEGALLAVGTPAEVRNNRSVIAAYLGASD